MRAAIYIRVSSPAKEGVSEQDKRQTTENQKLKINEWLKYQRDITEIQWFKDEQSARTDARPEFKKLIEQIEKHNIDVVIGLRVDRLFRSMKDLANYAQFFQKNHVGMMIIDQGINIDPTWSNPTSQLLLNILGAIAEFEDVLISNRTKDGLERVKKENRKIGRPPFGFLPTDKKGEFIPDLNKIKIAKSIIRMHSQQKVGYNELAEKYNVNRETVRYIIKNKNIYFKIEN